MDNREHANECTPSTLWGWRKVKIGRAPQAGTSSRPKGVHSSQLARRDTRKPLQVTIVYRGGPEAWWELRARGRIVRRPGYMAIHDVLSEFDGTL